MLARSGAANGRALLANVTTIAGLKSPRDRQLPFGDIDVAGASRLLGVPDVEIEARMYGRIVGGVRLRHSAILNGADVRRKHVDAKARRFSPSALRANLLHRAIWDLKPLPCCLVGGELLLSRCPACGKALAWRQTALHLCGTPTCRFDLRDASAEPVDEDLAARVRMVDGLFSHDGATRADARRGLPADVRHLSTSDVLDLTIYMGLVVGDPLGKNVRVRRRSDAAGVGEDWTTAELAAGADVVSGWPGTMRRLVGEVLDLADSRSGDVGVRKQLGPLVAAIRQNGLPPAAARCVEGVIEDVVGGRNTIILKARKARNLGRGQTALTLGAAAKRYRIASRRVGELLALDIPGLRLAGTGGRGRPLALNPAVIDGLMATAREVVASGKVVKELGLGMPVIERLLAAGEIVRADAMAKRLRRSTGDYLSRSSVEDFLARVDGMSRAVPEGGVVLHRALTASGRGDEAVADILLAILDGRVPLLRIDPDQRRLKSRLVVDRMIAHDHLTAGVGADGCVSVVYAAEALGLKEEAVRAICAHFRIELTTASLSPNLRRGDLDRIHARFMTLRATAAVFGLETRTVRSRLMRLGVVPAIELMGGRHVLYDREHVERRFAEMRGGSGP